MPAVWLYTANSGLWRFEANASQSELAWLAKADLERGGGGGGGGARRQKTNPVGITPVLRRNK